MKKWIDQISSQCTHAHTIRWFRIALGIWVIFNFLLLLPAAPQFWSETAYIHRPSTQGYSWFETLTHLLADPGRTALYPLFLAGVLISALGLMINVYPAMSSILVWFFLVNLDNQAPVIQDGGNNLIHLLLIYSMFMVEKNGINPFRQSLGNLSFYMARIQVALVYATAGIGKVTGSLWPKGVALYYTLNVPEYSHPILSHTVSQSDLMIVLGSYFTVLFQISFPYLVWNRQFRPWILGLGAFLHLGIALGMGLVSFGFAMCVSYTLFMTNEAAREKTFGFFKKSVLVVGFDENCTVCQRVAAWAIRWAIPGSLIQDRARSPVESRLQAIPFNHRTSTLCTVDSDGIVYEGFSSIYQIILRLPILTLLRPMFYGMKITGSGQWIYQHWILKSSWRTGCQSGHCEWRP